MFTITCIGSDLQARLKHPEAFYPPEVCQELTHFLEILQRDGHFSRTEFYDVNTNKISAVTFNLFYRPDFNGKKVLVIDLKLKPADVFKQRFKFEDDWDDRNAVESIPQYDKPSKLISAIELIHRKITDSYQLGYELGHRGSQDRYIARHGQYAKHALEQLKLIRRTRQGRKLLTELTDKGQLIATAPSEALKSRLLIETMLSYPPVWKIIVAVTEQEGELNEDSVLNDNLIKNLIFPEVLQEADTSNRRSQTLRGWIKYISDRSGIPVRLHKDGVQLPIPMIYSE